LYKNNLLSEKEEEQFFDEEAKKFLSDRFIEGAFVLIVSMMMQEVINVIIAENF
jgi:hypothetical protein